jgi:phosphoribosylglycinamide formyltransferase-1
VENSSDPLKIGVLISGRGSNLQSLIEAEREGLLGGRIAVVISNREDAAGLRRAREAEIPALVMPHQQYSSRDAYDAALVRELRGHGVQLVCLAGFMRVVSAVLCDAFPNAVLNIHPSLLPAFPGVDAQRQALEHGVKVTGATVHFVTAELDGGPIVLQAPVPVLAADTVESLSARILATEHRLYPEAVRLVAAGNWRIEGRRVVVDHISRNGTVEH